MCQVLFLCQGVIHDFTDAVVDRSLAFICDIGPYVSAFKASPIQMNHDNAANRFINIW